MREIKFRAWDTIPQRMSPVLGLRLDWEVGPLADVLHPNSDRVNQAGLTLRPSEYVLMQFTGLYDKHGTEIYEGDIVKIKLGASMEDGEKFRTMPVEFFQPYVAFCFRGIPLKEFSFCPKEVIGNIYENPELSKLVLLSTEFVGRHPRTPKSLGSGPNNIVLCELVERL